MAGEPFIRLLNRAKSSRRLSVPIPGIIDKQRHLSLMYQPPFSISSAAVNLIAEISALVERYAIRLEQSGGLRLRTVGELRIAEVRHLPPVIDRAAQAGRIGSGIAGPVHRRVGDDLEAGAVVLLEERGHQMTGRVLAEIGGEIADP